MSYAKALKKTESQSVEATFRQRRLLFAGALAREGNKRLPKRLLFAERLEGGDPGPGQLAQHWQKKVLSSLPLFVSLEMSLFPSIFVPLPFFSLYGEYTLVDLDG